MRNPVYLGKVRQAGELFEGEHEAIIDETLWGDVQRMLEDNVKNTRTAKNRKSNALLAGLLYDDAGNRMVLSPCPQGRYNLSVLHQRAIGATIKAFADAKGFSDSYVWKILRLSYLAPDIIEAILDGRQPSHLSLHQINAAKLSGDWSSQRRALGFPILT